MKGRYSSGIVDSSTIFHLLANYYETVGGNHVGQSLCGRMKGPVKQINERQATCYSCLETAKGRPRT